MVQTGLQKRIFTGATLSQSFDTVQFFGNQIKQN